jgi:hypothetical protein
MFKQLASTGCGAAFLDRLDEPGVVFQHPVHRFDYELCGVAAGAAGEVLETGLFVRR